MKGTIQKLYFTPRIDSKNEYGAIGGFNAFIAPRFAQPNDWHIIYKTPIYARPTPVICRRPLTVGSEQAIASQIAIIDFSQGRDLENGQTHPEGTEICFNEAQNWQDAPQWVVCALDLAGKWYRPLFQKKNFTRASLKNADLFLNPYAMGEVIERTDSARQTIIKKVAICLLWDFWSKRNFTLEIAARQLVDLKIDPAATAENLGRALSRMNLTSPSRAE